MARIRLRNDPSRVFELKPGSNTLGREGSNNIVAESPGVSRHHATIRWESPHCRIIDHGSTNGTFVNGERVETHGLRTGDVVRTGPVEWELELDEDGTGQILSAPPPDVDATVLDVVKQQEATGLRSDLARRGRPIRSDKDLSTLYRIVDLLVAHSLPQPLLEDLVQELVEAFSASGAAGFLVDANTKDLELAAGATDPPHAVLPVSKTIVGMSLARQESLLVRDAAAEGLSAASGSIVSLRISSALAAPLSQHDFPLGALQLSRSPDQQPFNQKDLKLFSVMADLVGMALLNCRRREELETENVALGEIVKGRFAMLGNSPSMRKIYDTIEQTAKTNLTILLQGESGTGKELVARALHSRSPRRAGPFVALNCAAMPESLAESELFGHEAGAFTGARDRRTGCFERSHRGTLFLDEVGELSPHIQGKLLRVLEHGELVRVGGESTVKVDVRMVAATNRDLESMVRAGEFRQDLFFRLQVVLMHLPPLRERLEDIPLLAEHFLEEYQTQSRTAPSRLAQDCMEKLRQYPWPGNVRELRNAVVRACVLSSKDELTAQDFSFLVAPASTGAPVQPASLDDVERNHIRQVLEYCGWKREAAAEILGIDRKTLFNKIHKYNLARPFRFMS
jgi:transcriptional regulator with GAF, ATPase, and Fis domain